MESHCSRISLLGALNPTWRITHRVNISILETARLDGIERELRHIRNRLDKIEMTIQEAIDTLAAENVKLDDISAKLTEGFTEISDLLHQLQNTTLTPEQEAIVTAAVAKVDAIQPQAQQIADIVPGP